MGALWRLARGASGVRQGSQWRRAKNGIEAARRRAEAEVPFTVTARYVRYAAPCREAARLPSRPEALQLLRTTSMDRFEYAKIRIKEATDLALSDYLLETVGVAVVPGSAFGAEGYFRISFATSMDNLKNALDRIEKALA